MAWESDMADYDLVIRGGEIHDGLGSLAQIGDVGLQGAHRTQG